jgi:hypothetical protein
MFLSGRSGVKLRRKTVPKVFIIEKGGRSMMCGQMGWVWALKRERWWRR